MSVNKNQSSNRKSDLLSKEVEHIDITSFDAVSYTHLTLPTNREV